MLSREAGKTVTEASNIAKKMNDEYVSLEHLILAIFKSSSKIAQILKDQGVTEKHLKAAIEELRKGEFHPRLRLACQRNCSKFT